MGQFIERFYQRESLRNYFSLTVTIATLVLSTGCGQSPQTPRQDSRARREINYATERNFPLELIAHSNYFSLPKSNSLNAHTPIENPSTRAKKPIPPQNLAIIPYSTNYSD